MKKLFLYIIIMGTFSLQAKNKPSDMDLLNQYDRFMQNIYHGSSTKSMLIQNMIDLTNAYARLHYSSNPIVQYTSRHYYNILVHDLQHLTLTGRMRSHYELEDQREVVRFNIETRRDFSFN